MSYLIDQEAWLAFYAERVGISVDNLGERDMRLGLALINVLERCGMIREGRRRQILPLKSGWSDNVVYAILETDERRNK